MTQNVSLSEKLLKALEIQKSKPNESYEDIIWEILDKLNDERKKNLISNNKAKKLFFAKNKTLDDIFGGT